MTKMTAMPIYGITLKIFFPGTSGPNSTKRGMKHQRPKLIIVCSNNTVMILIYFTARSNVYMEKNVTMMNTLEIIAYCDLEFGLFSKLNY